MKVGDIIQLKGFYYPGDGGHHFRKIEQFDNGSGILLKNGLYANLIHNGKINVKCLGLKGDSLFDNTNLMQKALDVFLNTTFYFPKGVFKMKPIITRYHQRIVGEGWNSIIMLIDNYSGLSSTFISNEKKTILGKEYTAEHIELHNIVIDGNKVNNTKIIDGISLKETWGGEMMFPGTPDGRHFYNRIIVKSFTGNGIVSRAREVMIVDSFIAQNDLTGLIMYNSDSYVSNTTSFQNGQHGIISSGDDIKYNGIKCFGNGVAKTPTDPAYSGFKSVYPCTVTNISVQENGGAGIECTQLSRSTFSQIFLSSNNLTLSKDVNGYPIPHSVEKYQIKLVNPFGNHIFDGITLSDFRKTLVKKVFYCEGSTASIKASVTTDPNLRLNQEDYLTLNLYNERVNYNNVEVIVDGGDIIRRNFGAKVVNGESNLVARIARVKLRNVVGKGANSYFDVKLSLNNETRNLRVSINHEGTTCSVSLKDLTDSINSRIEFYCGGVLIEGNYIYFDLYATGVNYQFINVCFDNLTGFYFEGFDTTLVMHPTLPQYNKIISGYPNDWISLKSRKIKSILMSNEIFKGYMITDNVITFYARVIIDKPVGIDPNINVSSVYLPLPKGVASIDKVLNISATPNGYEGLTSIIPNCFNFSCDYDDEAVYLKVCRNNNIEPDIGQNKNKLVYFVSITLDFND